MSWWSAEHVLSDKIAFVDESFPRRCHRDDEMGAETSVTKNPHAGMGMSRWNSTWETVGSTWRKPQERSWMLQCP